MFLIGPYSYPPGTMLSALQRLGLTTNLKVCLDAGDIDSYSGSGQTWTDVSGNSLNFTNGENGSDATGDFVYTGTAGRQSSSEYFAGPAGGALFQAPSQTWIKSVHKDNGKITIAAWAYSGADSYAATTVSTALAPTAALAGAYPGFSFGPSNGVLVTAGLLGFLAFRNDGGVAGSAWSSDVLPNGWAFTACAIDEAAGTYLLQINGTQYTGSLAYTTPSANDPGAVMTVRKGLTGSLSSRANSLATWDIALSAVALSSLFAATRGKFGV